MKPTKKSRGLGMCKLQILLEDLEGDGYMNHETSEIRLRCCEGIVVEIVNETVVMLRPQRDWAAQPPAMSPLYSEGFKPHSVMQNSRQLDKSGSLKLNHALQN